MKKVALIYATLTGNTEAVAEIVKENVDGDVELVYVTDADESTVEDADLIIYGCSTTGYGEILDDFLDYYDEMSSDLLENKKVAVFGLGDEDNFPDTFCNAGVLIYEKVKECNADIVAPLLKISGDYEDFEDEIIQFAKSL